MDITKKQFDSLHLWCRQCEAVLNKEGLFRHGVIDYRKTYRWSEGDFKHYIYKPFLKVYAKKESTKDQDSCEPSDVSLALTAHFQTDYNVELPKWPSNR